MNILSVGNSQYISGGDARVKINHERLFELHGHDVIPFAPSSDQNLPTAYDDYFPVCIDPKKPKWIDVPRYIYNPASRKSLVALMEDVHLDLAHLHIYYGRLTSSILGPLIKNKIPIVQSLHDYKLGCAVYSYFSNGKLCTKCEGKYFYKSLVGCCNQGSAMRSFVSMVEAYYSKWIGGNIRNISHFVAVSEFMKTMMLEIGVPEHKISVIYNYVATDSVQPCYTHHDYYLYLGRLDKIKGIDTLLTAFSKLGLPLKLVGDGAMAAQVRDYVLMHGLGNIEILGHCSGERLDGLMKGAKAIILPSIVYEICPMSVIEAFLYGKPVIGSNIGGIPELIDHEVDGLLFEPGDVGALCEAVLAMEAYGDISLAMGRRGRLKAEMKFNPSVYYSKMMELYSTLV